MFIFGAMRVIYIRRNAARERKAAALIADGHSAAVPDINETAFSDLTDRQNVK